MRLTLGCVVSFGDAFWRVSEKNAHALPHFPDYEVSFLRLVEKVTNGTTIEISYTGTTVLLHPGLLPGGIFTHTCPLSRSIGYFLEPLVVLGCFGKRALEIRMDGITSEEGRDLSVS